MLSLLMATSQLSVSPKPSATNAWSTVTASLNVKLIVLSSALSRLKFASFWLYKSSAGSTRVTELYLYSFVAPATVIVCSNIGASPLFFAVASVHPLRIMPYWLPSKNL